MLSLIIYPVKECTLPGLSYRVVVVNSTTGEDLEELYLITAWQVETIRSADLSAYAGEVIVLSFEQSHNADDSGGSTPIDNVSITDDASTEFVTNGDFETGDLTGWATIVPNVLQNMTSTPETMGDVDVTRSFYTVPNQLWGRWVDEFTNNGASEVSLTVVYKTDMGSDGAGVFYNTPGANERAVTTWDSDCADRDAGFVIGDASLFDSANEEGYPFHEYDITVPAGDSVVLVNFIVMTGDDTCQTAGGDLSTLATNVDGENLRILNGFCKHGEFRDGMTAAQIANVINF